MVGKLSDTEVSNLLCSQAVGRLACAYNNQPYIVPVTYLYNGKYIYGQTNGGMKLDILRNNPNVCFEVDLMTDMRNWKSVVVYGKFEELEDEQEQAAKELFFNHMLPLMTSSTIHSYGHEVEGTVDDSTRVKNVMYRISIDKVTGRFEKQ